MLSVKTPRDPTSVNVKKVSNKPPMGYPALVSILKSDRYSCYIHSYFLLHLWTITMLYPLSSYPKSCKNLMMAIPQVEVIKKVDSRRESQRLAVSMMLMNQPSIIYKNKGQKKFLLTWRGQWAVAAHVHFSLKVINYDICAYCCLLTNRPPIYTQMVSD